MNKTCARCEKTVYPTEELKCLDKVWHKGCFKCQECGMTLNMRTYKGYGKLPYCESHVPKAKHTTMAETPELKRIAENTKIQSNVKYHADFEKSKGKFTQVADDPETLRIKANTRIISNVAYHGDLEKKAQMEKQRQINENGELVDVSTDYHQQIDSYATEMLPPPHLPPKSHYQTPVTQYQPATYQPTPYTSSNNQNYNHQVPGHQNVPHQNVPSHQNHNMPHQSVSNHQNLIPPPQSYSNQNVAQNSNTHQSVQNVPSHQNVQNVPSHQNIQHQSVQNIPSHQNVQHQNVPAHQNVTHPNQNRQYQEQYYQQQNHTQKRDDYQYQYQDFNYGQQQKIGRIQDYDPLSDGPRAAPNTQRASATLIYNSTSDKRGAHQSSQSQQTRQIGRVTELDPLANEVPQSPRQSTHQSQPNPNQNLYIAMYDYEANDSDEVSFREGDVISNVSSIDSGWMTGQVVRTGRAGMLPANYVAHYDQHQQY